MLWKFLVIPEWSECRIFFEQPQLYIDSIESESLDLVLYSCRSDSSCKHPHVCFGLTLDDTTLKVLLENSLFPMTIYMNFMRSGSLCCIVTFHIPFWPTWRRCWVNSVPGNLWEAGFAWPSQTLAQTQAEPGHEGRLPRIRCISRLVENVPPSLHALESLWLQTPCGRNAR